MNVDSNHNMSISHSEIVIRLEILVSLAHWSPIGQVF